MHHICIPKPYEFSKYITPRASRGFSENTYIYTKNELYQSFYFLPDPVASLSS
ncbi:hypothetical protein LguiB_009288 [Lonicera macranthoides]